jgi:hypothetical protein
MPNVADDREEHLQYLFNIPSPQEKEILGSIMGFNFNKEVIEGEIGVNTSTINTVSPQDLKETVLSVFNEIRSYFFAQH